MRDHSRAHDDTMQGTEAYRLVALEDLSDYKVADGDPDVRGWDVRGADGRKLGKVDRLIVDTGTMRVRYLDIELDKDELRLDRERHVLVPIGGAGLDDDNDVVNLRTLSAADLAALPAYEHGAITRDEERSIRQRFDRRYAPSDREADFYEHDLYDDRRFFGNRRRGRETDAYLIRVRA